MDIKACQKCVGVYQLPKQLLGNDKDMCYWCCKRIVEIDKIEEDLRIINIRTQKLLMGCGGKIC